MNPNLIKINVSRDGIYIIVNALYSGGQFEPPLFWKVREIMFETNEVIYEMKEVDFNYYDQN
jgi:uncharacterized Fe-S cluster-containing MiaB family protein